MLLKGTEQKKAPEAGHNSLILRIFFTFHLRHGTFHRIFRGFGRLRNCNVCIPGQDGQGV